MDRVAYKLPTLFSKSRFLKDRLNTNPKIFPAGSFESDFSRRGDLHNDQIDNTL